MSSENEYASKIAASALAPIAPSMRPECGRRNSKKSSIHQRGVSSAIGQDALLRRHAAMQERSTISALILTKLRRIDEERVAGREQRVGTKTAAWQL